MNINTTLKTLGAVAALLLIFLTFRSWLSEHDARITSSLKVEAAEHQIADLRTTMAERDRQSALTIAALRKKAVEVKTPEQAVAAIPDVSQLPLNTRPIPEEPSRVSVEALPLYQELNSCAIARVELNTCKADLADERKVIGQKDEQITALKKPKGFWKTLGGNLKMVGVGIGIGLGLGAGL